MSYAKMNQGKPKKIEMLQSEKQDAIISLFIQALAIKEDTNMTRIYSAIQSGKKNQEYS
jgi:hypothetical protein